jgi:exonuclease SbcC
VGLVTHVAELAERVPVRFHITKDAKGSHVEKTWS